MDTKLPSNLDTQVMAILASFLPYIGGPISNVLNGMGSQRKFKRVEECLSELAEQIRDFESDLSDKYVRTEDFEEILEKTLRKFVDEHDSSKRLFYANFLATVIMSPNGGYDEQEQVMPVVGKLSKRDLTLLRVYSVQPPSVEESMKWGIDTAKYLNKCSLTEEEFKIHLQISIDRLTGFGLLNKLVNVQVSELGISVLRYLMKP
ncbi:MAG: hypothetical protein OXH90_03590 [Paracoccaceae bacterium]|nr:hypothetical protein [Paracoccaceae bacterium]MDE2916913.1 hypothetical protein [Paracoccaceae bacterium]